MQRSKRMEIKPLIRASAPQSTAAQCQETHSPQLYISQVSRQENYDNIQTYKHIFNSAVTLKPWLMDPLCDIYSPSSLLHCFFVVGDKLTLALELLGDCYAVNLPSPIPAPKVESQWVIDIAKRIIYSEMQVGLNIGSTWLLTFIVCESSLGHWPRKCRLWASCVNSKESQVQPRLWFVMEKE